MPPGEWDDSHLAAAALAAAGKLTVPTAATYPLTEAAEAHRVSEGGHVRGKLIFLP
ncbi:zinc-binding dehydrogenase [Actinokineospora inagensis]|uniref:zinc-binding dehydrogenase n=1 Tax=Actinokineospora inagensis TaxID=103730 RepID=UPI0004249667|nr:zinc-binding dehydrogenase [Actinokineospora inagensis]